MDVKTYRAKTLQEALQMIQSDLGPDASILQTRQVRSGMAGWFRNAPEVEVSASATIPVPRRLEEEWHLPPAATTSLSLDPKNIPAADTQNHRDRYRSSLAQQGRQGNSLVEELCGYQSTTNHQRLPETLFQLFTELIDAELSEELVTEWIDQLQQECSPTDQQDIQLLRMRLAHTLDREIRVTDPIFTTPGQCRLVALVGPTGVGKTTTIAKLAANFHLRDQHRVGLITVDTYRIAAVDQLRTYADIIDLPMEVVSTPREMRAAIDRLADLDLVLMDTAGRSPRDDVRIQELRAILAEANADEIQLVLSSVASTSSLVKSAQQFSRVGTTSLVLTKLDEATGLGNLIPLFRSCELPISYLTNGQNVPHDIESANSAKLARIILGMESVRTV
ncbi:MAG: flagellar biosynthesis protein FlhF [Pirellulaceae bacterium]